MLEPNDRDIGRPDDARDDALEGSDRFLRIAEVCRLTGVCVATVYRWVGRGTFPPPRLIGPQMSRWSLREVQAWMEAQPRKRIS